MTRPIVIGVDGSRRSLHALEWAARTADVHDCPLKIVHVLPRWVEDIPFFPPGRFEEARKRGRRIVAEAAEFVREEYPGLEVSSALPYGVAPAKVFLDEAEKARAIVLGAKGSALGNLALGSVSLQTVGYAASPVVIVNRAVDGNHRIVVGTDLSRSSSASLDYAFEEASRRRARLQVMYVWKMPYPPKPPLLFDPDPKVVARGYEGVVEEQISALREHYPEVDAVIDVQVRTTPIEALTAASARADLLVLGSRLHGGFRGLAIGSVSHYLLHNSACPVAVVRPAETSARPLVSPFRAN
ncbi:universal stress protein [Actinospica sp. MGRD01-02]|uniref:Universal stress protein n=1 Tax=Actinospica acidithermotolerans TaxID=2828514 RepID=A0A941EBI2_9ACTN|nr:universal stress protein [Actinospica acidithermotolerans]MBR7828227.1 universal stress protein [Actinospica acidithermotolerans]